MRHIVEIRRSDDIAWAPGERWLVDVVEQTTAMTTRTLGAFPTFRDAAAAAVALDAMASDDGSRALIAGIHVYLVPSALHQRDRSEPRAEITIAELCRIFRFPRLGGPQEALDVNE